jgi:hypothetical protein
MDMIGRNLASGCGQMWKPSSAQMGAAMFLSFALEMTAGFRMMAVSATSGFFPALIIRWHVWRSMGLERLALKAAMKSADRLVPFRFRTDRFQVQANARDLQILNKIELVEVLQ